MTPHPPEAGGALLPTEMIAGLICCAERCQVFYPRSDGGTAAAKHTSGSGEGRCPRPHCDDERGAS